ncbi:MAG: hypothetical protein EA402_08995 [Planctomycetota bacterium]|nr:MAG: hypothetical protein EA402_08995 [Planctomycetota bacterium]
MRMWIAPQCIQPGAKAWLSTLPHIVATADASRDIYRGRNHLLRGISPWGEVVIKSFRVPSILQALGYTCRRSKALRSLVNGLILQRLGMPTPQPIAAVEERDGWRLRRSWYVCALVSDAHTIRGDLDAPNITASRRISQCGALAGVMHNAGLLHADFSPGNIIFSMNGDPYLVDINRMRLGRVSACLGAGSIARMYAKGESRDIFCAAYAHVRGLRYASVQRRYTAAYRWLHVQRELKNALRPWRW